MQTCVLLCHAKRKNVCNMNKCTLPKHLNSCPYLADECICNRPLPHSCSMLETAEKPKSKIVYVRKERWYEKYYKGSK